MTFTKNIEFRQLENTIWDLNQNGYTVSKSKINGNNVILFYDKTRENHFLKRKTLTLTPQDFEVIQTIQKTKIISFERFFGFFRCK